jgi:hypothetical protein
VHCGGGDRAGVRTFSVHRTSALHRHSNGDGVLHPGPRGAAGGVGGPSGGVGVFDPGVKSPLGGNLNFETRIVMGWPVVMSVA